MRKLYMVLVLLACCVISAAQSSEVTLVVSGEGHTKEEATNNALRSAVEQAFGVFVSANTEVLQDEIIREEIATVSSGTIKTFNELAYVESPSGTKMVTLSATVSIGQLVSFSKAHNLSTELAGATIASNMKLYELNERSTSIALTNIYNQLFQLVPSMYDYSISSATPTVSSSGVIFDLSIDIIANENTHSVGDFFYRSLEALSMTRDVIAPYLEMGYVGTAFLLKQFEGVDLKPRKLNLLGDGAPIFGPKEKNRDAVFLYGAINFSSFKDLFLDAIFHLEVEDNQARHYYVTIPEKNMYKGRFAFENLTSVGGQYSSPKTNSFCRISPPVTGVYGIKGKDNKLPLSKSLPDNCIGESIIVFSKFNPGDIVYSLKGRIVVQREDVSSITGFMVHPTHLHTSTEKSESSAESSRGRVVTHTVKYYEDIEDIARSYGVTVGEIMEVNGLKSRRLTTRQVLKIPVNGTNEAEQDYGLPMTLSEEKCRLNGNIYVVHPAREGETLLGIAKAYGVSLDAIYGANPELKKNGIREGTIVLIPCD